MSDNNNNNNKQNGFLSLTQGQRFNNKKYNDIKKPNKPSKIPSNKKPSGTSGTKEGFTSNDGTTGTAIPVLIKEYTGRQATNTQNQANITELQTLQSKYDGLLNQYNTLTNQIKTNTQADMDKISPSNPYLGKNITLGSSLPITGSGAGGYVTSQGIFKNYPDTNTADTTIGKNGCPVDFTKSVQLDKYSKLLSQGSDMVQGQSCGSENSNVYVSSLNNNPSAAYIGCYNNSENVKTLIVPKMNSTNSINGFVSSASSTYQSNNNTFGPWKAFDQNINTYWHSEYPRYSNGQYTGTNSLSVVNSDGTTSAINGEYLVISMPGINTSNPSPVTLTSYDIQGRQDCCGDNPMTANGRNPHTWYIVGYDNNSKKWYQVDYQDTTSNNANYNKNLISFSVPNANQKPYTAYAIIVTTVGDNSAPSSTKTCVQISSWNLYTNTTATGNDAMIDSNLGYTTIDSCQSYALDNGYQYYAMQTQQSDGTASCMVSNDKTQIVSYGQPETQVTTVPMWASNTVGSTFSSVTISITGQLTLSDGVNTKTLNAVPTVTNSSTSTTSTTTTTSSTSNFYLMLQSDGNMILYSGQPGNDSTVVFSTQTSGQQEGKNSDWVASKGKYSKPFLLSGQVLNTNEWIGSSDGSMRLIMQTDGNLVLYTSTNTKGCSTNKTSKKMYGSTNVNAVYQIDNVGYTNNLGNIGYVDKDTVLHSYPSSMLGYSGDYTIYDNYNSTGNDISQIQTTSIDDCKTQCNNYDNNGCAGFIYEKASNICNLKSVGVYPKSPRQYNTGFSLGVRNPSVITSPYSNFKMNVIDSIQYQNYPKGDDMTSSSNYNYNEPVIDENTKNQITQVQNQLTSVASQIVSKMEEMAAQDKNVASQMNMNDAQFKDKILQYKMISSQLSNTNKNNIQGNIQGKKEGMQNLSTNDLNGMLEETDLRVLQENYGYIFWSILAVGLLTVTVNVMKKGE